ncbi:hypothetical protein EV363DRAFT_962273 [Boletus edulis]|nr:hypothetical protein EV363DRAFT_962273 [Boletus edulis]
MATTSSRAVFEVNYAGALGDPESSHANLGVSDTELTAKRNWWAAAREVVCVTKGKKVIISGGVIREGDYRSPRDIQNLCVSLLTSLLRRPRPHLTILSRHTSYMITLLGVTQNLADDASAVTTEFLVLRAYQYFCCCCCVLHPPDFLALFVRDA